VTVLASSLLTERIVDPNDAFVVTPILDWRRQVSEGSIDLRLDWEFIVIARTRFASLDPLRRERITADLSQYQQKIHVPYGEKFVLHPNELVLGSTVEFLSFPDDLMAYVIGRSSWGRLGLIIATATQINPGFKGNLTLELVNAGNVPVVLYPGVRIAQLVVHQVNPKEVVNPEAKYALQIGPGFSKIYDDPELNLLRPLEFGSLVGLTGHKGSGKFLVSSYLVQECGFRYYSLSRIVRELFERENIRVPSRKNLQDFGDLLRLRHGGEFLAREFLRRLQREGVLGPGTRIVVDGIRNDSEARLLFGVRNFTLIAIEASKERIMENLRQRGSLIDDNEYEQIKQTLSNSSVEAREALRLSLETKISTADFEKNYVRDCGESGHLGQNIPACIVLAEGNIVRNDGTISDLLEQLWTIIGRIE
jgi:dCTP deaminase